MRLNNIHRQNTLLYALILVCIAFCLFSYPFLKIPYDMWEHLVRIRGFYEGEYNLLMYNKCSEITKRGFLWYYIWASFFKFFYLSNTFYWPKIIHTFQLFIAISCVFFYCLTIFKLITAKRHAYLTLSMISTIFWLFGNGLSSVAYHNAWIMWYSLNYQCIGIALLWLMNAISIIVAFSNSCHKKNKLILIGVLLICCILLIAIHPLEFAYFLIHLSFILLVCWNKYFILLRKHSKKTIFFIILSILSLTSLIVFLAKFNNIKTNSQLVQVVQNFSFQKLFSIINTNGIEITTYLNKFPNAYSELTLFSLGLLLPLFCFFIFNKKFKTRLPLFLYITFTSLTFILIPTIKYIAGLFGLLTMNDQVYRFVMASSWFLILPLFYYLLLLNYTNKKGYSFKLLMSCSITIILCLLVSKYIFHQALYNNTISIINSFDNNKVGVNYSKSNLKELHNKLKKLKTSKKKPLYYVRGDLAYPLRFYFGHHIFSNGKRRMPDLITKMNKINLYKQAIKTNNFQLKKKYEPYKCYLQYNIINIQLSNSFPKDKIIFKHFHLDKPTSKFINIPKAKGIVEEITSQKRLLQSFKGSGKISTIKLLLANFNNRRNTKDIIIQLYDDHTLKTPITSTTINASIIKDNKWQSLNFPPITLDPHKIYYILLSSPEAYSGNAITAYHTGKNKYKHGELSINNKKTGYDLCIIALRE